MKITTNDLLEALEKYGRELPKRPSGKGWTTIKQMALKKSVTVSRVRWQIQTAIQRGLKIERFVGSDYDEAGQLVKQTWFRVAQ